MEIFFLKVVQEVRRRLRRREVLSLASRLCSLILAFLSEDLYLAIKFALIKNDIMINDAPSALKGCNALLLIDCSLFQKFRDPRD